MTTVGSLTHKGLICYRNPIFEIIEAGMACIQKNPEGKEIPHSPRPKRT